MVKMQMNEEKCNANEIQHLDKGEENPQPAEK